MWVFWELFDSGQRSKGSKRSIAVPVSVKSWTKRFEWPQAKAAKLMFCDTIWSLWYYFYFFLSMFKIHIFSGHFWYSNLKKKINIKAVVTEWLRRWTWNPLRFPRAGSNPAGCETYIDFFMKKYLWSTLEQYYEMMKKIWPVGGSNPWPSRY